MCSWLRVGLLVEQGCGEVCHYDWLKARLFVVLCLKFTALRRCSSLCFEVIDDRCEILYLSSLSLLCHRPRKPPFLWIPLQSSARYTRLVVACAGWVVLAALPSGCGPLIALEEPWTQECVEFSLGSLRSFVAACHIALNLWIWYRANCESARSLSITEMQSQTETLWQTEPEVSVMAWWFESSWNICAGEKLSRTATGFRWDCGLKVSGTSARRALSVTAREISCQSAIPRGRSRTFARVRSAMHIITQAGVDSTHFFLTSLLSFSRPLQKAGSA